MFASKYFKLIGVIILALALTGAFVWYQKMAQKSKNAAQSASQASQTESQGLKTFMSDTYGFSFQYPPDFTITEVDEQNGGYILLAQSTAKNAFQIFITPFNEPGPITAARIHKDLPKMLIDNPQNAIIGGEQALIFFSNDDKTGKTREVWFINSGFLYQVESSADFDEGLSKIMATFKFQ